MLTSNGFSELAKLLLRYGHEQTETLQQILREKNYTQQTLIDYLTHEGALTRKAAVHALGLIGDVDAVPPLIESLRGDDPTTCLDAEQALWAIWFRSGGDESVDTMLKEGANHIKEKRYQESIEVLTEAIRIAPDFAEAYNQRAIAYFLLDEWLKSIDDCKKTVELNPYHFGAFAGIGQCYLRLGKLREAINAFQKALELNPNLYSIAHTVLQIQRALREHFGEEE